MSENNPERAYRTALLHLVVAIAVMVVGIALIEADLPLAAPAGLVLGAFVGGAGAGAGVSSVWLMDAVR